MACSSFHIIIGYIYLIHFNNRFCYQQLNTIKSNWLYFTLLNVDKEIFRITCYFVLFISWVWVSSQEKNCNGVNRGCSLVWWFHWKWHFKEKRLLLCLSTNRQNYWLVKVNFTTYHFKYGVCQLSALHIIPSYSKTPFILLCSYHWQCIGYSPALHTLLIYYYCQS